MKILRYLVGSVVGSTIFIAGWLATYILVDVYREYNAFRAEALFENGVLINHFYTSRFSRSEDAADSFHVAIDAQIPEAYAQHIRLAYGLLADMSGRSVSFELVTENVLADSNRYIYVSNQNDSADPHSVPTIFVDKMEASLQSVFPNPSRDIFWRYQKDRLAIFYGTPLFFNSEFGSIDYKGVIEHREPYRLMNTNIDKTVVYINVPPIGGAESVDGDRFARSVILQEIFQEYNLASDISDSNQKLKTILYDHDEKLDGLTGSERLKLLKENSSQGLCPYDIVLTYDSYRHEAGASDEMGLVLFLYAYSKSHFYHLTYPPELFDERCWLIPTVIN